MTLVEDTVTLAEDTVGRAKYTTVQTIQDHIKDHIQDCQGPVSRRVGTLQEQDRPTGSKKPITQNIRPGTALQHPAREVGGRAQAGQTLTFSKVALG